MTLNEASILESIKKPLGLAPDYTVFDDIIVMHINSSFSTLHQLGIGPETAYSIESKTNKWGEFIGDNTAIESVKSYIYIKVRLLFDPPETSFGREAFLKQAQELEWRLNVQREEAKYPWPITTQ